MQAASPSLIARFAADWQARPERVFLRLHGVDGDCPLTGAALTVLVRRHAAGYAARGVGPGDRVALVLPTGEGFLGALFGAWWVGAAVLPLCPPRSPEDAELMRIGRAISMGEASLVVVPDEADPDSPLFVASPCPIVRAVDLPTDGPVAGPASHLDLAVIQFSSGSTGFPKGVSLTDAALQANLAALQAGLLATPDDCGVSWLPLHHDMGLVGTLFFPLWVGFVVTLLPPELFIRQPARWLNVMSEMRATVTTGPTFGYALAARLAESATPNLDLSSLRACLVGAEPVHTTALEAFATRFARSGFKPTAFVPTYGLAEATLGVTLTPPGQGAHQDVVSRSKLADSLVAEPIEPTEMGNSAGDDDSQVVVGNGPALPGVTVAIRGEAGQVLAERHVGAVWVRSPGVMSGYWGDAETTATTLSPDGWLNTGDLGYMADGTLFIVGREKELIIRAGRKYHPADLEAIAEAEPGVRAGGTAAFAVLGKGDAPEQVVLLFEPRSESVDSLADLAQRVKQRVLAATGLRLDTVFPVAPRSLPRTTSGKRQRGEARRRYLKGEMPQPEASATSEARA